MRLNNQQCLVAQIMASNFVKVGQSTAKLYSLNINFLQILIIILHKYLKFSSNRKFFMIEIRKNNARLVILIIDLMT